MEQAIQNTIRLMIVDAEVAEAEAILNVFRDAGYSTRGHHINSGESLEEALIERTKWDLLLISELPEDLGLTAAIDLIAQQGRDIPVIVLADNADAAESLELARLGARAVVPRDSDEHLLLCASKEIEDLKIRRHYRRMSVALNESEKQRRVLLDDQVDAMVYIGEGLIRYVNPAFMQLVGIDDKNQLIGKPFKELVANYDRQQVDEFLVGVEDSGQAIAVIQCPLVTDGGSEQPVRAVISPTSYEGEYTLSLLVRPELLEEGAATEQEVVQEIQKTVEPDNATGLFDKSQFQEQLDVAIQRVVAGKNKMALMCITLDTLKIVHEKGGRKISQPMLLSVAKRLSGQLSPEHQAASWGGGIFMVLLKVEDKKLVQKIADDILTQVAGNIDVNGKKLPIKLSLGAILLSDTSNDSKTLLVRARHAAGQSLKGGGGKLSFYQERKVNVVDSVEKHLAGMVSQALKNDNMQLFYQPVVSLKGCSEEYYEVFLRMTDVRGREHDAASFRAKLEKNALWNKVDRWQLIQASKDLMSKRRDGHDTRLIVHLGASAISDKGFVPWMGVALKAAGIPTKAVAVELSEPNLVRFSKEVSGFFKAVKKMGCQAGVSDFGCSLNPLATIEPLDIDLVRVDASFTKDITSSDKGEELAKMIEALAQKKCKVIVPQVESAAEMAPLWHRGVDFIQGPFLQSPSRSMNFDFGSDI